MYPDQQAQASMAWPRHPGLFLVPLVCHPTKMSFSVMLLPACLIFRRLNDAAQAGPPRNHGSSHGSISSSRSRSHQPPLSTTHNAPPLQNAKHPPKLQMPWA